MFRPLIEKKRQPNYARKIQEWISANKMRIFFSNEKTGKGHRICCSNSNDRDQLSVNKKTVKLNVNPSLTHVRTESACYELKGDLSPLMLNEIFHDSLKFRNLQGFVRKTIQAWMSGKSCFPNTILIFGGRCNRYFNFETCGWKLGYHFNMLFQLVLTKFFKSELFSCLPKVDDVIN